MSRLKKTLNDLIVSLEGFTDQPLSNDDVNDLGNQFKEIEKAEISLEAYCNAYNLCNMLNESNTLSMESYSAIMTLAESNKSMPACLNISLEDETSPSMLKNIKDKIIAAFKWLRELWNSLISKIKNVFNIRFGFLRKTTTKINVTYKDKNFDFKNKIILNNENDRYSSLCDGESLFSLSKIEEAIHIVYKEFPELIYDTFEEIQMEDKIKNYYKQINSFGNGKKSLKLDNVKLRNIDGSNIYIGASIQDNNDKIIIKTFWGADNIRRVIGKNAFPKEIVIEKSFCNNINDFVKLFKDIEVFCGEKFNRVMLQIEESLGNIERGLIRQYANSSNKNDNASDFEKMKHYKNELEQASKHLFNVGKGGLKIIDDLDHLANVIIDENLPNE